MYYYRFFKYLKLSALALLLIFAACFCFGYRDNTAPKNFMAEVIHVYDGDTMLVRDNDYNTHAIRLASIDAPEWNQPYGKEATIITKNLVLNKRVLVETLDTDKYNRKVARIFYEGDKELSSALLQCGAAWHFTYFDLDSPYYSRHKELQQRAKEQRIGLWETPKPVAPWVWREQRKK